MNNNSMAFKNLLFFTLSDHFKIGELVSGTTDGSNTVFTTASPVGGNTLDVYVGNVGGFQLMGGGGIDYTLSGGNTITFNTPPPAGSIVLVDYIH